jgi:two-component system response regulator VanR
MTARCLRKEGYTTDVCASGEVAFGLLYEHRYDLVILDIMLPGMSGQEILKELRRTSDMPILMMTALSDEENQLRAFEHQADDYVVKPFSLQILVKRVEALLRRSGALCTEIRAGALTLYPDTLTASYRDVTITLTPKEFDILRLFVTNSHRILMHETLLVRIWGYDFDGNQGIVHASIKKLRDKLPAGMIQTVKGFGYRLMVDDNKETDSGEKDGR